jgi:hypothetical protein
MKKLTKLGIVSLLAVVLCQVTYGEVFKFDFGTKDSPLEPGYTRVTETDVFSTKQGFGWKTDKNKKPIRLYSRNENFSTQRAFLKMDALLCDHVTGGRKFFYPTRNYKFKVKLAKGEYVAAMVMGKITEKYSSLINRPPYWYMNYEIKVNGTTAFTMKRGDIRKYLSGFCTAAEANFIPGDSLFNKYLKAYFPIRKFTISGDEAIIEISSVCPVNALLIYPKKQKNRLEHELTALMKRAEEFINSQYKEQKPELRQLSAATKKKFSSKGMIIFSSKADEITPYTLPTANEMFQPVGEFLPVGEKGVLRFGLLPLKDLKNVKISLADFVSKDGKNKISKDCLDLWLSNTTAFSSSGQTIYYKIRPWYAFPYKKQDFIAGASRQFFLYVKLPTNVKPGDYSGTITYTCPQGTADYKLFLKVMPFKLIKPDTSFGMYAYSPLNTRLRFANMQKQAKKMYKAENTFLLTNELQEKAMAEMAEAGLNTVAQGPNRLFGFDKKGKVVEIGEGLKYWNAFMKIYQQVFGDRPIPAYGIGWGGLTHERIVPGFWCQNIKAFKQTGLTAKGKEQAAKLVRKFYATSKEQGWPEIIFYDQDEMANHGIWGGRLALERAKFFRKLSKEIGFRTCASMNGPVELPELPYLDIAIPNGSFPLNAKNVRQIRKDGCEYWIYNIGSKRYTFGFYLSKDLPKGRLQWAFYGTHNYLGQIPCLPSLGSIVYATMWDSNLNPSRRLDVEGIRQGIMDYRYFMTLQKLVKKHQNTKNAPLAKAVQQGNELLKMISGGVEAEIAKPGVRIWSQTTCQRLRWRLASAIMEMQNAE